MPRQTNSSLGSWLAQARSIPEFWDYTDRGRAAVVFRDDLQETRVAPKGRGFARLFRLTSTWSGHSLDAGEKMPDDTLKQFRRLVREAQSRLAAETVPSK